MTSVAEPEERHEDLDARTWAGGGFVGAYANRTLRPVEVVLLVRYRDALSGRVLELGSGAGRLTSYLADIGSDVHGIDLSEDMVEYARRAVPRATFHQGDLTDLSRFGDGSFDAVVAPYNVLDVLSDARRRGALDAVHRIVADGGMLIMSSHNRGHAARLRGPGVRINDPLRFAADVLRMPVRLRNRRRLVALQEEHEDYAVLNDNAHNYSLLHYYIDRDAQERQLSEHGWALEECLDLDAQPVAAGDPAEACPELHYAARRAASPASRGR